MTQTLNILRDSAKKCSSKEQDLRSVYQIVNRPTSEIVVFQMKSSMKEVLK